MAAATAGGGAEMGQGLAPSPGAAAKTLATQGTWMPTFGVQGLDASEYQPSINWQQQWNMGARFAYIKASEGNYYTNPILGSQYGGSRAVGMMRGAYHYANPAASSGADQARIFVQSGGNWTGDGYTLPPVLDFEGNPYAGQTINGYYQGNDCYDMSPGALTAWARDFSNTMYALTGRLPVIYTGNYWWRDCVGNPLGFGDNPLWLASYPSSFSNDAGPIPASWSTYSIWQYSSTGPFAGDSNVWAGDYASLQRFAAGSPPPAPTDATRKVISTGDFDGDGKSDLIQRRADGELWLYSGDGTGRYPVSRRIGAGWQIYDSVVGVGDYNGDGKNDLVARKLDGSLWFYAGTGFVSGSSEGYRGAVKIGAFGWDVFNAILGVRDFDGDGKADLLARTADGALYLYSGTGTGQTGTGRKIDFGWEVFNQLVAIQDFDGDGTSDLVGRKPDGTMWFYSNTGKAALVTPRQIGTGWGIYDQLVGTGDSNGDRLADFVGSQTDGSLYFYAGTAMRDQGYQSARKIGDFGWGAFDTLVGTPDFNGDGTADLLARMPDGSLWFYPGTGTGTYGTARKIGNFGWDAFDSLTAVGDFNGDGKSDLLARKPNGSLWIYPGTGRVDASNGGYAPAVQIGKFGWDMFDSLVGTGDLDRDGKNDVLARGKDGSLWLYRGTSKVDALNTGYQPGVKIGAFGWEVFAEIVGVGDFNSDRKNDVLARRPDGTLWFYAGDGTGKLSPSLRVGTGWNVYDNFVSARNLDADANPDLVARRPDGSLWSYSGTGMKPSQGYLGRTFAGSL
ncbi:GH25 family lysozyme [Arthrobacter sp. H16F315]|uniref:GH25 family lysozyme n=1 Tax=Arthrobacter sp. H16F315 TaxID=2955314 RepID=UPI0020971F99|nr:GH25 family lysozyme [Arthrobacter sp. H16F315]MDD1477063.1 GH25 family lysozyme [Arthrobacter sp. H16F315]